MAATYVIVLVARGWGAHRIIHWEDLQFVGRAISQPWWWNLNDQGYGILIDQSAADLITIAPIHSLGVAIFVISTVVWAAAATTIAAVVTGLCQSRLAGSLAGFALVLLPLPELAQQAQVRNLSVAVLVLAGVVAATTPSAAGWRTVMYRAVLMFAIAASNPVAIILALPPVYRVAGRSTRHPADVGAIAGVFLGVLATVASSWLAEPELAYAHDFVPDIRYEENVLGRFEEVGATTIRGTAPPSVSSLLRQLPGVMRFVTTQVAPEPWRSDWLLPSATSTTAVRVASLALLYVGVPTLVGFWLRSSTAARAALWLIVLAVGSVLVPLIANGSFVQQGYLAYPIAFLMIGAIMLGKAVWIGRRSLLGSLSIAWLAVLGLSYATSITQNFRDPFDANPRQGALGRYEDRDLWGSAVASAHEECTSLRDDDYVVVSQRPGEVYFDSPMILRCRFLR